MLPKSISKQDNQLYRGSASDFLFASLGSSLTIISLSMDYHYFTAHNGVIWPILCIEQATLLPWKDDWGFWIAKKEKSRMI